MEFERTLFVVDQEEPEGSLMAQEKTYGVGCIALFTETTIVTPEELDSRTRLGEEVKV